MEGGGGGAAAGEDRRGFLEEEGEDDEEERVRRRCGEVRGEVQGGFGQVHGGGGGVGERVVRIVRDVEAQGLADIRAGGGQAPQDLVRSRVRVFFFPIF